MPAVNRSTVGWAYWPVLLHYVPSEDDQVCGRSSADNQHDRNDVNIPDPGIEPVEFSFSRIVRVTGGERLSCLRVHFWQVAVRFARFIDDATLLAGEFREPCDRTHSWQLSPSHP